MALSESQKRATSKYIEKNDLVEIKFRVTREQRSLFQENAKNIGYNSFNQFVIDAIIEKLDRK